MRLHRTFRLEPEVSRWLLLPGGSHAIDANCCRAVPRWLLLPQRNMPASSLQLWVQVPGGISQADQVPIALLLPGDGQLQHDLVPDRLQLRRGCHVRTDCVLSRDLRVVPWQEVLRLVPRGTLLPGRDPVGAVSGGVVLPYRRVGADAVPCEPVLPAGVGQVHQLPSAQDLARRVQVSQGVQMSANAGS